MVSAIYVWDMSLPTILQNLQFFLDASFMDFFFFFIKFAKKNPYKTLTRELASTMLHAFSSISDICHFPSQSLTVQYCYVELDLSHNLDRI